MRTFRYYFLCSISLLLALLPVDCANAVNSTNAFLTVIQSQKMYASMTSKKSAMQLMPVGSDFTLSSLQMSAMKTNPLLSGHSTASSATDGTTAAASFKLVFKDEFNGHKLDKSKWAPYYGPETGHSGSAFNGLLTCQVGNGELTLHVIARAQDGRKFTTCGVGTWNSLVQTYGKYEFRARIDPGSNWDGLGLIWPIAHHWPPEVDICEYSNDRTNCMFTVHYDSDNHRQMTNIVGDFTSWHIYTLEWVPGKLTWLVDGKTYAHTSIGVPDEPMWFGLMTDAQKNASHLGAYYVDWVRIYKYKG